MHIPTFLAAAIALLASGVRAGEDFKEFGITPVFPRVCGNQCGPVVTLSGTANSQDDVCGGPHMHRLIPRCELCTSKVSGPDAEEYHQSVVDLLNTCNLEKVTSEETSASQGVAAPTSAPMLGAGAIAALAAFAL